MTELTISQLTLVKVRKKRPDVKDWHPNIAAKKVEQPADAKIGSDTEIRTRICALSWHRFSGPIW